VIDFSDTPGHFLERTLTIAPSGQATVGWDAEATSAKSVRWTQKWPFVSFGSRLRSSSRRRHLNGLQLWI